MPDISWKLDFLSFVSIVTAEDSGTLLPLLAKDRLYEHVQVLVEKYTKDLNLLPW